VEFLESKYLYIGILLVSVIGPIAYSFEKQVHFYSKWKEVFAGVLVMMLIFIPWDAYFSFEGIWWFNAKYTSGINILYLPIEEWAFFIVIPFCCVFLYEVLNHYIVTDYFSKPARIIFGALSLALFVLAILFKSQLYTSVTFILTALALLLLTIKNPHWTGRFFQMYLVSWIPFTLVNGALTGMFTNEATVNYNPDAIIGFRLGTIPIEDSIYSLLMLLVVIFIYERLRKA
jgi:lycopene cyclase domain-containing protein